MWFADEGDLLGWRLTTYILGQGIQNCVSMLTTDRPYAILVIRELLLMDSKPLGMIVVMKRMLSGCGARRSESNWKN